MKIIFWKIISLIIPVIIFNSFFSFEQNSESKPRNKGSSDSTIKFIIADSLLENKDIISPRRHRHKLKKRFVDSDSDGINDFRCRGFGFGSKGYRRGRK